MVTIKDLATRLGVSPSTITRALADSPRISAETKAKVHEAAAKMGYVADTAAKVMRSRQNTMIGLVIPDIENSFYALVAKAFSEICNRHSYQLMLAVSEDIPDVEERHIQALISSRASGIAIVPSPGMTARSLTLLSTGNVAQFIRVRPDLHTDCYGVKDADAIEAAIAHLIDLNHARVGLICGLDHVTSGRDRFRGYASALAKRKIDLDPSLVLRGPPRAGFGQSAATRLRTMKNPPTAIVAAGAGLTEGLLNAANSWGDADEPPISMIGFSDCPAFRWWQGLGLTTVDLPIHRMASDMCLALIDRASEPETVPQVPRNHIYGAHLILRGSTRPLTPT